MLADMTKPGLYHWGCQDDFPELVHEFRLENLPTAENIFASPIIILVEGEEPVG